MSIVDSPASHDGDDSPRVNVERMLGEIRELGLSVPLILDFDETLLLRNSTEEYLDGLRPRIVGHALLMLLGLVKPWRLWPEVVRSDARDMVRVAVATILLPWSRVLWLRHAKRLAHEQMNRQLMDVVAGREDSLIVATNGFRFLVRPILDEAGLGGVRLVSVRMWGAVADRTRGKRAMTVDAVGESALKRAVVVTDSAKDAELIAAAHQGYVVQWPDARYRPAMSGVYFPLVYLDRIKHPGQQFFIKTVLADDWVLIVLAVAWVASNPLRTAAGTLLLMLAFWTIYEVGYLENDRVAETLESDPALRREYFDYQVEVAPWMPWTWAFAFSAAGVWVLDPGAGVAPLSLTLAAWSGVLVFARLVFRAYNHVGKLTRMWLYPVLHIPRTYGVLLLLPTNIVGALALASQLLSRWIAYVVYRQGGVQWPGPGFVQLVRLVVFVLLVVPVTVAIGAQATLTWQFAAVGAWFVVRGRRGLLGAVRSNHRIERDPSTRPS